MQVGEILAVSYAGALLLLGFLSLCILWAWLVFHMRKKDSPDFTLILVLLGQVNLLYLPLLFYTFHDDTQLILFGWQLWGTYMTIGLLLLIFILSRRSSELGPKTLAGIGMLLLSFVNVWVCWSDLFSVYAMVSPIPYIPPVRDQELTIPLLVPRLGSILGMVDVCVRLITGRHEDSKYTGLQDNRYENHTRLKRA